MSPEEQKEAESKRRIDEAEDFARQNPHLDVYHDEVTGETTVSRPDPRFVQKVQTDGPFENQCNMSMGLCPN